MKQTATVTPATRWKSAISDTFEGTPGRLRIAAAAVVAAGIMFALVSSWSLNERSRALHTARDAASQVVLLQDIRTQMVTADAAATNAFLTGGIEPRELRERFETAVAAATADIATAAGSSATDAATLDDVNTGIASYVGLIESARANNRQGYPAGTAYLRQASQLLRGTVLPALTGLAENNQHRVAVAYENAENTSTTLAAGGLVALFAFAAVQMFIAIRSRRTLNKSLLAASTIVGATFLVTVLASAWSQQTAAATRSGSYRAATALTAIRTAAFDAKSNESLTLIARGSGQGYEQQYQQSMNDANDKATIRIAGSNKWAPGDELAGYETVHTKIRELDDNGNWEDAVKVATQESNIAFAKFDTTSHQTLDKQVTATISDLNNARSPLGALRWIALTAGLIGAVVGWRGVSQRLREYR